MSCVACGAAYQVRDGIPIFTERDEYWGNVDREKMRELIHDAEASGDWLATVERRIPRYAPAFVPFARADAQFLFPIGRSARVLDAGSMWGGLTVPIAQFCGEIYAVDKTWETLRLLQVRSRQMNIKNILPVVSPVSRLPFPDSFFDFVVVNGALEWFGFKQDLDLERHWDGRLEGIVAYPTGPETMQREALKELRRVLRPTGSIYVAIENRLGLQYFCGYPDDHVNIRFVAILPRWLANVVTRRVRNTEYRTYIYSPKKLTALLRSVGFQAAKLYSSYPDYRRVSRMTPFSAFGPLKRLATTGTYYHLKVFLFSQAWRRVPEPLCRYVSPSITVVASATERSPREPRLIRLLREEKLLDPEGADRYEAMLFNNRFANGTPTNYLVFDKREQRVVYFCKVGRHAHQPELMRESEILSTIGKLIAGSDIDGSVPDLVYHGVREDIALQVTRFENLSSVRGEIWDGLRRYRQFAKLDRLPLSSLLAMGQGIARRRWLAKVDPEMQRALNWLASFQDLSASGRWMPATETRTWLREKLAAIERNGLRTEALESNLDRLVHEMDTVAGAGVPLCMQHGDFDFTNVFRSERGGAFVVDFEHCGEFGLPFLDLANLLLNPLVPEWRASATGTGIREYARRTGWEAYLLSWLDQYAVASGYPRVLLSWFPVFGVIEQNAKVYPRGRNPSDLPLYGQDTLDSLSGWTL